MAVSVKFWICFIKRLSLIGRVLRSDDIQNPKMHCDQEKHPSMCLILNTSPPRDFKSFAKFPCLWDTKLPSGQVVSQTTVAKSSGQTCLTSPLCRGRAESLDRQIFISQHWMRMGLDYHIIRYDLSSRSKRKTQNFCKTVCDTRRVRGE